MLILINKTNIKQWKSDYFIKEKEINDLQLVDKEIKKISYKIKKFLY